jgi:hypothetical protein
MILLLALLTGLFSSSTPALANSDWSMKGDLTVGTAVVGEAEDDAMEMKVLVRAEYKGFKGTSKDPNTTYRYFWVKASVGFNTEPDEAGGTVVNSVVVNVTPVTKISEVGDIISATRYGQLEIRRNVELKIAGSVNVSVIGFSKSIEKPLLGPDGPAKFARFTKFVQVAVDLVGLRVTSFADEKSPFIGAQIGGVQASAGIGWNINDSVSIKVSLNAKGNLAYGQYAVTETDFYGQIALLFKHAYQRYSLYAAGGRLDFTHDGSDHGEYYVMIGLNTTF